MEFPQSQNGIHDGLEKNGVQVEGGIIHHHYRKFERQLSRSTPHIPHHVNHAQEFGSGLSAKGFGSLLSVPNHRLAKSKPTIQSSWPNVAVPTPLGASHVALDEDGQEYMSQEQIDKEKSAPADKFRLVYLIFMLHGIAFLLPWNMFLTANSYFTEFKLAAKGNETESEYAKNFLSYLGMSAQIPNVILCLINVCCQSKSARPARRICGSIGVLIVMFIATIILAIVDTQNRQGVFFGLTMATVVIINMFSGVYQTSMFGIAGAFPMKYTNSVILGTNTSGILTALVMIISLLISESLQLAAIWYFLTSVIVLCLALITLCSLPLMRFYKHFTKSVGYVSDEDSQKALVEKEETDIVSERPPYLEIFKKIWPLLLGVWLTFFVSLICFPAIQADIEPSNPNLMPGELYTPITTFLFFNLFATLGNVATEFKRKLGPKYLLIPIVLRVLYIPFFMLCNYRPHVRSIPVYISNDFAYFAGGITMAFTNGYFSSLCMMYAPSLVDRRWAGTAAMISAFFLVFGIVCGVNFTLVIAYLIETL